VIWAAFFLIVFGAAFVVTALIPRRHVLLAPGGFLLAVVCWILVAVFGGYGEGAPDLGEAGAALGAGLIAIVSLGLGRRRPVWLPGQRSISAPPSARRWAGAEDNSDLGTPHLPSGGALKNSKA
jgi:hypothetical protein